jgi:hypothetical protein
MTCVGERTKQQNLIFNSSSTKQINLSTFQLNLSNDKFRRPIVRICELSSTSAIGCVIQFFERTPVARFCLKFLDRPICFSKTFVLDICYSCLLTSTASLLAPQTPYCIYIQARFFLIQNFAAFFTNPGLLAAG